MSIKLTDEQMDQVIAIASRMGREAGEGNAGWDEQYLFGGRVTDPKKARESAMAIVKADDEGDFHIFSESIPSLSGEYSGDMTPMRLIREALQEIEIDSDMVSDDDISDMMDEICSAWEEGASDAYQSTIVELARKFLA